MELHPNEEWLINRIRKRYRFGQITITTKDGIPILIDKAVFKDSPNDDNNDRGNKENHSAKA